MQHIAPLLQVHLLKYRRAFEVLVLFLVNSTFTFKPLLPRRKCSLIDYGRLHKGLLVCHRFKKINAALWKPDGDLTGRSSNKSRATKEKGLLY